MGSQTQFIINQIENHQGDINALVIEDNTREPLLLHACRFDFLDVAMKLINRECDINITNCLGESLAHLMVGCERANWIDLLGERVNFTKLTHTSQSVFHFAAALSNPVIINQLFSMKPPYQFLNIIDVHGQSALELAIFYDNAFYFKLHLEYCKTLPYYQNQNNFHNFLEKSVLPTITASKAENCYSALLALSEASTDFMHVDHRTPQLQILFAFIRKQFNPDLAKFPSNIELDDSADIMPRNSSYNC